jgi:adenylate cyclase class 2
MREIEIKARVADKEALLAALESQGISLGETLKQHDVVYAQPGQLGAEKDSIWLRVRTQNDTKHIFTLKKHMSNQMDSLEYEVTVDSESEIVAIMKALGYELFSDLTKHRRKAAYKDYEICYDELPELGAFIEIEKLCADDVDPDAVREELWAVLRTLGITEVDEETVGYDVLERRHRGLEAN